LNASGEPLGVANRDIAQIESKAPIGCLSLLEHPHFDYGHAVTSPSSQVITAEIVQVNVGTGVYPDLLNRTCSTGPAHAPVSAMFPSPARAARRRS
jgi:hypothetical protein